MPESLSFTTALIIGLLGTTHCLAMCGGIASSLSTANQRGSSTLLRLVAYNLGRISSYTLAGLMIGLIGAGIQQTALGPLLRIFAGLLLVAMGLYIAQWWQGIILLERGGASLWRYISPFMKPLLPADTVPKAVLLGIGWGWLPCGLVYSTLIWSSAAESVIQSGLLMLAFGLGTLPAMLLTGVLAQQVRALILNSNLRSLSGLILIAMGIWTLPWQLLQQTHIH